MGRRPAQPTEARPGQKPPPWPLAPFLGQESPSPLHNLPRAKPHTPPAQPPKPCRLLSCMHLFQTGQVEKNWPPAMPGTHQDGPNRLHPTTTAVHAFPTVRVPAGPHRMSRPGFQDLFLGRPYLQAEGRVHLVSPPALPRGSAGQGGASAQAAPAGTGQPSHPLAAVGFKTASIFLRK